MKKKRFWFSNKNSAICQLRLNLLRSHLWAQLGIFSAEEKKKWKNFQNCRIKSMGWGERNSLGSGQKNTSIGL